MASNDFQLVKDYTQTLAAGDFTSAFERLDEDVVFIEPQGVPYAGEWRGRDGVAQLGAAIGELFTFDVKRLELFDAGERILIEADVAFTSVRSGQSTLQPIVEIYKCRDGLIIENRIFYHDLPALLALLQAA